MPEDSAAASTRPLPAATLAPVPLLSVVRGEPAAAELAAVVVVLTARGRQTGLGGAGQRRPSLWSSPAAIMRPQLTAGPGAWRASALPSR